jgi:hypothetical protein
MGKQNSELFKMAHDYTIMVPQTEREKQTVVLGVWMASTIDTFLETEDIKNKNALAALAGLLSKDVEEKYAQYVREFDLSLSNAAGQAMSDLAEFRQANPTNPDALMILIFIFSFVAENDDTFYFMNELLQLEEEGASVEDLLVPFGIVSYLTGFEAWHDKEFGSPLPSGRSNDWADSETIAPPENVAAMDERLSNSDISPTESYETYLGRACECGVNEDWEGAAKHLELCLSADPDPVNKVYAHSLMIQALDKLNGPEGESGGGPYGKRIKAFANDLNAMLRTDSINECCKKQLPNEIYQEINKIALWSSAQYKAGVFASWDKDAPASTPDTQTVVPPAAASGGGEAEAHPKIKGHTVVMIIAFVLLGITLICLASGSFGACFIFLLLTVIVAFFGVRVYISDVFTHGIIELKGKYTEKEILSSIEKTFTEAKTWKRMNGGPGKLNMSYHRLGGLISTPVVSAALTKTGDNWEAKIWTSAADTSKQGIPKRGGVAIKIREKCLEALARYV